MAAPLHKYLLGEQFQRMHGITVDQALEGYALVNKQVMDPEEYQQVRSTFRPDDKPWEEEVAETVAEASDPAELVRRWARDHTGFLVGTSPLHKARDLRDLTGEMRVAGRIPQTPLYRGAAMTPSKQVSVSPDEPLSFTEDRHVAISFARTPLAGHRSRAGGRVHKVDPTGKRGLFVPDYVERERTVGRNQRPEREWLIDPTTITPGE